MTRFSAHFLPTFSRVRQEALSEPIDRAGISILKPMRVNLERDRRVRMPEPELNFGNGRSGSDESARI
jgi:hypothetical protein